MREVPYVSFPHVTPGAYTALRNHGEICILNRSDGHVGLRFRGRHTNESATLLVFEAGRSGAEAFKRWCDDNRGKFGDEVQSLALVPHKLVPAPEYLEE